MVGNIGYNTQLTASIQEPLQLYYDDFDANGSIDPLLCYFVDGQSYPFVSRDDLLGQLPYLKKKFLFFKDYAKAQIQDILTPTQLEASKKLEVTTLATTYFDNQNGQFIAKALPVEAQIAPVQTIQSLGVNGDKHLDLILAGNQFNNRVKLGRMDSNHGMVFMDNGKGNFELVPANQTGIYFEGVVQNSAKTKVVQNKGSLFEVNNEFVELYQLK
ncbi:MAG: hypothetical protein ACI9XO_001063 [Paraglaciecola sp.]|jgi:hypothetical protein